MATVRAGTFRFGADELPKQQSRLHSRAGDNGEAAAPAMSVPRSFGLESQRRRRGLLVPPDR
jgi:hypothetical protein